MKRRRPSGSTSSVASRLKERTRVATQPYSWDPIGCDNFDDNTRAGGYCDDADVQHGSGGEVLDLDPHSGSGGSSNMRATKDMDCLSGIYPGKRVSRKMILEEDGHFSSSSSESGDGNVVEEEGGEMDENVAHYKGEDDLQESDEEGKNNLALGSFSLDPKMNLDVDKELMELESEDRESALQRARSRANETGLAYQVQREYGLWNKAVRVRVLLQRLLDPVNSHQSIGEEDMAKAADAAEYATVALLQSVRASLSARGVEKLVPPLHLEQVQNGSNLATLLSSCESSYNAYRSWWLSTADNWHAKTQRLNPGLRKRLKAVNSCVSSQVSASLSDEQRCKKKMHLPMKEDIVGISSNGSGGGVQLDTETYADAELYHTLIKDFLNDLGGRGDGVLTSQEQMQFISKRLRGQRRKDLERRATKGRIIKYEVNPKLQNFTFPREYNVAPMNVDEMFASLLGRRRSETTTPIHKEAEIL